jgi:GR25 family glycosyltransferase involved in LPS biosynthesis
LGDADVRTEQTGGAPAEERAALQTQAQVSRAFVVSIEADHYDDARERMTAQNVSVEPAWGYNGSDPAQLGAALALLRRYNMTETLHPTVNNWLACMHTSPGSAPNIKAALSELAHATMRSSPQNVDQLIANDGHGCVPKVVGIAAAHVRLWEKIANTREDGASGADPWYLVLEDDAMLCPGWQRRLAQELPRAPADTDVLKLFFFGHWRGEDKVKDPDGTDTPFLEVRDPLNGRDLVTAALYEILEGAHWDSVPIAGFYAGTQAYLIKRGGARKLLHAIRGTPFQDIDMTMMLSVKHYAWRRVMTTAARRHDDDDGALSLLQTVPYCNREPAKDWFSW